VVAELELNSISPPPDTVEEEKKEKKKEIPGDEKPNRRTESG
jgi:hypothetical protein